MGVFRAVLFSGLLSFPVIGGAAQAATSASPPLPDVRQLMREVMEHQKQLDHIRENYTYTSMETMQDVDPAGNVKKTETHEFEQFFVNGHQIGREVKKDGKPLSDHDQQKETQRVTKLVEKAQKTPSGQPLEGPNIGVSRLLEIMEVRNPRREVYRGRPTIVFDFIGRKDAKTHGLAEDVSKKLQGTVYIDEADREVAHMEISFNDNFRIAGGVFASIQKGSSFSVDQALVNGEIWLPVGVQGAMSARLLMVKGFRQRFNERDFDYKRFRVETQVSKDAKVVPSRQQ